MMTQYYISICMSSYIILEGHDQEGAAEGPYYVYIYIYTHVHICMCISLSIYIYIYTHVYI